MPLKKAAKAAVMKMRKVPTIVAQKLKQKAPKLPTVKGAKAAVMGAYGKTSLQASLASLNISTILGMIFVIPIAIGFYVITKIGVYGTGNAVNIANLAGILLGAGALGYNILNKDIGGLSTTTNLMILLVSIALVGYAFMNANKPTEEKKA